MNTAEPQEVGVPYTHEDAVAENIDRIRCYHRDGDGYASTSQKIMMGLALCRPDLLEQANFPNSDIKAAWARLNDAQREAVTRWWKD